MNKVSKSRNIIHAISFKSRNSCIKANIPVQQIYQFAHAKTIESFNFYLRIRLSKLKKRLKDYKI